VLFGGPALASRLPAPELVWRPWIHCDPAEDLARLVLHRAVRDYGGIHKPTDAAVLETQPVGTPPDQAETAHRITYRLTPP
jgi:hypothetical protein